ncbi:MAG: tRNA 4-thiouridine(8) synthase ThiI [Ruminococcaceae bacterium]|nr:tRNA 4-thiouridine(8) synthase ThiI [Oscillospiraceae bacterium]
MNEVILCKYGEIILKGQNKGWFENIMLRDLRARMKRFGEFEIRYAQSIVYIEPQNEDCDIDAAFEEAKRAFGFAAISRAAVVEKDIDAICECAREYLPQFLYGKKTFKVEGKRSDKRFPLTSPQIGAQVGAVILETTGGKIKVDVNNPEITVRVEIRDRKAYVHAGSVKGAGGMPIGTNGKGLLLLSGGIDSPVAGYMIAKRGVIVEALHFESFPYTSERAREKVLQLAEIVAGHTGRMKVHIISLTHIQEELVKHCEEDYFTLLLRRFMMKLACMVAEKRGCEALITGESLGQVASQTMRALTVTDIVADRPVFRPCIGMDKEDIVQIARKIDTFETSILPYEDCCTVFTPKHPRTRPELHKVEAQEALVDVDALINEAFETLTTHEIRIY